MSNGFMRWSSAAPSSGNDAGGMGGLQDFDDLEARIIAAKEANIKYKTDLALAEIQQQQQQQQRQQAAMLSAAQRPPVAKSAFNGGNMMMLPENNSSMMAGRYNAPAEIDTGRGDMEVLRGGIDGEASAPNDIQYEKFLYEFKSLTRDMTEFVEKNKINSSADKAALGEDTGMNDAKRKEENQRRKEMKDKINSLLRQYDKSDDKIPLWRHRLRGNFMPRADQVLKPKSILRGLICAVFVFYSKPKVAALRKKRAKKAVEEENLHKTMTLFRDACHSWMGKLARIPISSIVQDNTLDFYPSQFDSKSNFRKRMIQLKVRVKAIVGNIIKEGPPPSHIVKFLGMLIEDGNYFTKDFLFQSEIAAMEFNVLGATRLILQPLPENFDINTYVPPITGNRPPGFIGLSNAHTNAKPLTPNDVVMLKGKPYNIQRARMLIRNFIFIKLLVAQELLTPWACGICSKPFRQKKKTIMNYRITASIIYDMINQLDPTLPSIQQLQHVQSFSSKLSSSVATIDGDGSVSIFSSLRSWLMRANVDDMETGLEEQLIKDPKPIETLPDIGRFLLPKKNFASIQSSLDVWVNPLIQDIEKWVDMVVRTVIIMKYDPPAELPDVTAEQQGVLGGNNTGQLLGSSNSNNNPLFNSKITTPRI